MLNPISVAFKKAKAENRPALLTYTVAGDSSKKQSLDILKSISKNADILEVGVPHNTPVADGSQIQTSAYRAIKKGIKLNDIFKIVRDFKKFDKSKPIILMGYYNPIYQYGVEKFITDTQNFGVDGFIIVDMPPEEDKEFVKYLKNTNMDLVKLLTPTTNEERLQKVLENSSGFLYYVSVTGITGTKKASIEEIEKSLNIIKTLTKLPIAVGFGISTQKQIKEISNVANAAVVGSHIVKIIENEFSNNKTKLFNVEKVLKEVKTLSLGLN